MGLPTPCAKRAMMSSSVGAAKRLSRYADRTAPIDVIFTDINLGGSVSGWEVAERFRMDRPDGVVLYTSAMAIDPRRCCPDSVFLAKPYLHDDILSACERLRIK